MSGAAETGEFVESRCSMQIHLHPSRLGNVREGVEEQLNASIMKYVDSLGGVLISYSDLSLTSDPLRNPLQAGFIFQERSFIHFSVTLKALTWQCAPGARYTGVVNAVAPDHLSVLLHGIFTATIPLSGPSVPKGWRWDADRERWIDSTRFAGEEAEAISNGTTKVEGDAVKDEDSDDEGAAAAAAAAGKKLTKKELKKIERRKLRAVMLAATGRTGGGPAAQKAPVDGVIVRGVHLRFECTAVQHTDEYLKLTGLVVPSSKTAVTDGSTLGLVGGFTPLAPLEGTIAAVEQQPAADGEQPDFAAAEADIDMDAIMAVTAKVPAARAAVPASPLQRPAAGAAPSSAAPAAGGKVLTAAQQERAAKKKAKLAERMAAKSTEAEVSQQTPAKKQKKVKSES